MRSQRCDVAESTRISYGGVLAAPEQREAVRPGQDVLQSRVESERKTYLVRVVVDVDRSPPEVVTAYRTSKIEKYWRTER